MFCVARRLAATVRAHLARFGSDERGSLAFWFAIGTVPLLLVVGTGLDYGRGVNLKSQLQSAADSAALAGAGAYVSDATASKAKTVATTYMSNFAATMGSSYSVNYTVTTSSVASGSTATLYAVTVTASAKLANSIMAMSTSTTNVGVSATAKNPVYTLTLTLTGFSSSAVDANSLYYYIVPGDGSVPSGSALTQFYTNNGTNYATSATIQLTASQKLGFMLQNITGGRGLGSNYTNSYQGSYLSRHYFYSHLFPPSKQAYPGVTKNCSLQVTGSSAAVTSGTCFSSLFPNSAVNCADASGKTLIYSWNDMGGSTDDKDYDDVVYTVKCSQNDATAGQGVVLTN